MAADYVEALLPAPFDTGAAGDSVPRADGWTPGGATVIGANPYQIYTQRLATLWIDNDMSLGT